MSYRILSILLLLLFTLNLHAQSTVTVTAELQGCDEPGSIQLFSFEGLEFVPAHQPVKVEGNSFVFELPRTGPTYYYVGGKGVRFAPFILGSEDDVLIKGFCKNLSGATIANSPLNKKYKQLKQEMSRQQQQTRVLATQYNTSQGDEQKLQQITEKMGALDEEKLSLLDSLRESDPFLAKILAINTYLSYQHYGQDHANELEYFVNDYFRHANLSDPAYNDIAYLYESFKNYTNTLISVNLPKEQVALALNRNLSMVPKGSRAHRYAMGGALAALQAKTHPLYLDLAQQMEREYKGKDVPGLDGLQANIGRMKSQMVGGEAPDFVQADPDGHDIRLSDLRGKVVLIDFWASWCGPCRRENPQVVKLYEAYKDKGFEIIGVSLDRDKNRWLQAIEKDGLDWLHVSDLKGWKNEVAQQYGVSSIPHTVLLDEEGRILARKLRGAALERKVAEVLGE